jgi:hypothetical protein
MAIRNDFAPGEVLAAADLNDTFGSKVDVSALPILSVHHTQLQSTQSGSTNASTWTDVTNLSSTITPKSNTSKFLIVSTIYGSTAQNTAQFAVQLRLTRGGSEIAIGLNYLEHGNNNFIIAQRTLVFLDSPATESAVTYKTQVTQGVSDSAETWYVNRTVSSASTAGVSTMTIWELP